MLRPRRLMPIAAVAALGLAAVACSSTPSVTPAQTGTTGTVPEDLVVPDAAVTAGFVKLRATVAQVKVSDAAATATAKETIEEQWSSFEGTVRKNDKAAYLQIEDGLASINAGIEAKDQAKVDAGVADVEAGAKAYLAKHP
jgi:hypothetical protein